MKKYIAYILLLGTFALIGCDKEQVPDYSDSEDRINFALFRNTSISYPDDLSATINFNDPEYDGLDEVPVEMIVQVQGYGRSRDNSRDIVFKTENESGVGGTIVPYTYSMPAGQDSVTLNVRFLKEGLVLGKEAVVNISFDFSKTDFLPGVNEKQIFTLTAQNLYTYASVGMTEEQWYIRNYGMIWQGNVIEDGYGPFSSQKALFIVETLGITNNFLTDLPATWDPDIMTTLTTLRAALDSYKLLNAQDPDTYPALIDEVKGGSNWIDFAPE